MSRLAARRKLNERNWQTMLVLTRKKNESIVINDVIKVTVVEIRGDKVRLGIEAPREIDVHRQEVYEQIHGKREDEPQHEAHAAHVPPTQTGSGA
jgi:carbon storage regulator